jgi:hypothetical protein
MNKIDKKISKWQLTNTEIRSILFHITCFVIRILLFSTILFLIVNNSDIRSPLVITRIDDFGYLTLFNVFLIYFVISSAISKNTFKYYLSVAVMFHNAVMVMIGAKSDAFPLEPKVWIILSITASIFTLEGIISIWILYVRRTDNNVTLFKKVGLNPKINKAFSTRRCLEAFGEVNIFLSVSINEKLFIGPNSVFDILSWLCLGYVFMTIIQQLLISVYFNEENLIQRKLAIFLTILKIPLNILLLIWWGKGNRNGANFGYNRFFGFLFGDMIALTLFMIYFLVMDYRQFGSGLKEYLNFKTVRVSLTGRGIRV